MKLMGVRATFPSGTTRVHVPPTDDTATALVPLLFNSSNYNFTSKRLITKSNYRMSRYLITGKLRAPVSRLCRVLSNLALSRS